MEQRLDKVLLHKSPSETLRTLEEAYGEAAMKKTQVYECYKRFNQGRDSINDDKSTMTGISKWLPGVLPVSLHAVAEVCHCGRELQYFEGNVV